jgi:carbamoyltransferase
MITWGIVANSHDASLAVFDDSELKWAALAKDFSGVVHDPHLNSEIVKYAKDYWGGPEKVVWYERPFLKTLRQWRAGQGWLWKENNIKQYVKKHVGYSLPIEYVQHHHSHAAYGYYTSGFKDASIICIDSIGEFETLTMWRGDGDKLTKVNSQGYPHSLGLWYSAMTQRLGFEPNKEEYMVSQLAREGDYRKYDQLIWNEFFEFDNKPLMVVKLKENCHRGLRWWHPEITDMEDLAAAVQMVFQNIVLRLTTSMQFRLPSRNLIVTGGCALNRDAMNYIKPNWDNLWIPPNPGDPGSCIGAVLASEKKHIDFDPKVWYNSKK